MKEKKFFQKARKSMERRGTVGAFTKYCGGKVTGACIERALRSGDPKRVKQAQFAKASRSVNKKAQAGFPMTEDPAAMNAFMAAQNQQMGAANAERDLLEAQKAAEGTTDPLLAMGSKLPGMDINSLLNSGQGSQGMSMGEPSLDRTELSMDAFQDPSLMNQFGQGSLMNTGTAAANTGASAIQGAAGAGKTLAGAGKGAAAMGKASTLLGKAALPLAIANVAGAGIGALANDQDATTYNAGEITGDLLQLKFGDMIRKTKNRGIAKEQQRLAKEDTIAAGMRASQAYQDAFDVTQPFTGQRYRQDTGAGTRFNYQTGGASNPAIERLKSQPKGSQKLLPGGKAVSLGNGNVEYVGNSHEEGGILVDRNTEVEGGEVEGNVQMKNGQRVPFIFSDYFKDDRGMSPADKVRRGISNQSAAKENEMHASTKGTPFGGPADGSRSPRNIAQKGGRKKLQGSRNPLEGRSLYSPQLIDRNSPLFENISLGSNSTQKSSTSTNATQPQETGFTENPIMQDNVGTGGERFQFQGTGPFIDYGGNINSGSWSGVYNTEWGKRYGVTAETTQEELKKIYEEKYRPEMEAFYEDTDKAIETLKSFAESDHPNASNFKRVFRGLDFNDPNDHAEIIRRAKKKSFDGKIGSFHMFAAEPEAKEAEPAAKAEEKTIAEEVNPELTKEQKERVPGLGYKNESAIPGVAVAGMAAGLLPLFAPKIPPAELARATGNVQAQRLPRVNLKEQEARAASDFGATVGALERMGMAGTSMFSKAMRNKAQTDQQISAQEAQSNANLAAQEAGMDLRAQSLNKQAEASRRAFNAQTQNQREQFRQEQTRADLDNISRTLTTAAGDVLAYQSDKRFADAIDVYDTRGYNRTLKDYQKQRDRANKKKDTNSPFYGKSDSELREHAASEINARTGYDPTNVPMSIEEIMSQMDTDSKRSGGYIKRSNKVRRKRRK